MFRNRQFGFAEFAGIVGNGSPSANFVDAPNEGPEQVCFKIVDRSFAVPSLGLEDSRNGTSAFLKKIGRDGGVSQMLFGKGNCSQRDLSGRTQDGGINCSSEAIYWTEVKLVPKSRLSRHRSHPKPRNLVAARVQCYSLKKRQNPTFLKRIDFGKTSTSKCIFFRFPRNLPSGERCDAGSACKELLILGFGKDGLHGVCFARRTNGEPLSSETMADQPSADERLRGALLVAATLTAAIRLRGETINNSPKVIATIQDSIKLAQMVLRNLPVR